MKEFSCNVQQQSPCLKGSRSVSEMNRTAYTDPHVTHMDPQYHQQTSHPIHSQLTTGIWSFFNLHSYLSLLDGCLTSQQNASVSQGRICSDNFTCCHTEIEVADQTFYLTQSQYTDTRPTSPSTDPIMPGAWQGSHWSANFEVTGMIRPPKNPSASGIQTRDLPLSRWTP